MNKLTPAFSICFSTLEAPKLAQYACKSFFNDDSYSMEGVHVLNITSNYNTITDSEGNFKIYANIRSIEKIY